VLPGCRHATGKAQHGNFLVAIKQEKGESARTSGEKPHGEEEVSSGARVPRVALQQRGEPVAAAVARGGPRPSLEGREVQAGLQAAPVSCQRSGICTLIPDGGSLPL